MNNALFGVAQCAAFIINGAVYAAPMTFDQALDAANKAAPSLQASALGVDASRVAALPARALPDPKLDFAVEGFPVSGPNAWQPNRDDFAAVRLGVSQDIPNAAKRRARAGRAQANVKAAEVSALSEARTVRLATALAWVDLAYASRKLSALKILNDQLNKNVAMLPSQLASGSVRPAETLAPAQLRPALADRRSELDATLRAAKAMLGRWTGDPEPTAVGNIPDTTVDTVKLRSALEQLPALGVLDAATRQADADVALAQADKRPDWGVQASYAHRDPRFGDMLNLGVSVSLPVFAAHRQDPAIFAKRIEANRARLERENMRLALVAAIEGDLANHVMHHARFDNAKTQLVPLAERRVAEELASYAARRVGLAAVLEARLALINTRLDLLDREADVARDAVRINLTYGSEPQ